MTFHRVRLGFALVPIAAVVALAWAHPAAAKIRVVASITDLASIAASVGGDQIEVQSISKPTSDVHRVEVLPSYMVRVSRAQLYLKVGLSLDQWADQIIDGSSNDHLVTLDCSEGVDVLDKPTGKIDARLGDVHPNGNPHYWLDPRNGAIVARNVAAALGRLDPDHASDYAARADAFAVAAGAEQAKAAQIVAGLANRNIVTYHASWVYLANAFGLTIVGNIEPVPGIPPTAKHLEELTEIIKDRKVGLVIEEPYFSEDAGEFLKRETGAKVVQVSPSCDSDEAGSYLAHFETILRGLAPAN